MLTLFKKILRKIFIKKKPKIYIIYSDDNCKADQSGGPYKVEIKRD